MPHLSFGVDPGAPPAGGTVTVDGDSWVVEHANYDVLTSWRKGLLDARTVTLDDLRGGGDGDPVWETVTVGRKELDALVSGASRATLANLRASVAALNATKRS